MGSIPRMSIAVVAALLSTPALAQSDLGALLDAGATRVSPASFREDVVQRVLVGPTANGGTQEVVYTQGGLLQGTGRVPFGATANRHSLSGEWVIDDLGRVCGTLRQEGVGGGFSGGSLVLPFRCVYWYKLGDTYFLSDSDVDRRAKVFSRKFTK